MCSYLHKIPDLFQAQLVQVTLIPIKNIPLAESEKTTELHYHFCFIIQNQNMYHYKYFYPKYCIFAVLSPNTSSFSICVFIRQYEPRRHSLSHCACTL